MKKFVSLLLFSFALTAYSQIDRTKMPEPGPAPEINLKEPQSFNLLNGLKVMVVENHKLPRVSMQLLIDNPPIQEGDKAGVSLLVASLLGNGTKSIPKDDYNEEVDFLGARINFGSQSAFATSLSKYFPRILELLADAAINPNFTAEDFEKEKARIITGLKAQEKNVSAIAGRVQNALTYGKDHPYGEFSTEETVNNVTLADVQQFHLEYFVPANAYLVIIGDVNYDQVVELVTENFTPWTKASPPSLSFSKPSDVQYTQINFVDMPNAVQSEISVQNLVDLRMSDADYLSALVANRILGGGGQARLYLNLREDKGYTYGSYSSLSNDKYAPAIFSASASVRNAVTDSSVVEIIKEIDRIVRNPVTEEELKNVKAEYIGSFVMALERPETIARYALNIETEGLPADFYQTYLERINAVSIEDVQKAAQKYFSTSNARIVVTGKGSEVLENLEKVDFNGRAIPLKYFDPMASPTDKPEYGTAIPEGITVQSVIEDYFKAIGGLESIKKINSLSLIYEGNAMGATIRTEEKRTADKYAQTTYQNNTAVMGVIAKGDELYMKQGANKIPLPEQMRLDLKKAMGIFPEQSFVLSEDVQLSGIEKIEGREAYRIEVPGETVNATYFYDAETGLKVKEKAVITIQGQTQEQEINFKDYQEIEGIKFPGLKISTSSGRIIESRLQEAKVNVEVSDADFE